MRVEYTKMASKLQEMEARLKAGESMVGSEGTALMPSPHNIMMGPGIAKSGSLSSFSSLDSEDGGVLYSFDEEDLDDEEAEAIRTAL